MLPTASIQKNGNTFAVEGPLIVDTVNSLIQEMPAFTGVASEIDMTDTTELDSAGLSLLVLWEGLIEQQGGSVTFSGMSAQAASLMEISGLGHMVSSR